MLRDVLESERFETTIVDADRGDAVRLVRVSRPDVLVIDLRMGSDEMRGWTLAQQVRAHPDFHRLPVLVCSADVIALEEISEEVDAARNVASLAKPFGLDDLTAAIDSLLAEGAAP